MMTVQIDVQHLSYAVQLKGQRKLLLKDVTLHIDAGDMCALMVSLKIRKSSVEFNNLTHATLLTTL